MKVRQKRICYSKNVSGFYRESCVSVSRLNFTVLCGRGFQRSHCSRPIAMIREWSFLASLISRAASSAISNRSGLTECSSIVVLRTGSKVHSDMHVISAIVRVYVLRRASAGKMQTGSGAALLRLSGKNSLISFSVFCQSSGGSLM